MLCPSLSLSRVRRSLAQACLGVRGPFILEVGSRRCCSAINTRPTLSAPVKLSLSLSPFGFARTAPVTYYLPLYITFLSFLSSTKDTNIFQGGCIFIFCFFNIYCKKIKIMFLVIIFFWIILIFAREGNFKDTPGTWRAAAAGRVATARVVGVVDRRLCAAKRGRVCVCIQIYIYIYPRKERNMCWKGETHTHTLFMCVLDDEMLWGGRLLDIRGNPRLRW